MGGVVSFGMPLFALAQATLPPAPTEPQGLITAACRLAGWMFAFLIIVAIIFVIIAAYRYLTASGDPEKITKANQMLVYAAVAIIVGVIARGLPFIVANTTGIGAGGGFTGC